MTKLQYSKIIASTVFITLVFDILVGRYLIAKVSTLPILNKLKILSPQAPIVINNRETIRISDNGDVVAVTNNIKSKISTIVQLANNGTLVVTGNAINLTSDGAFLSAGKSFLNNEGIYFIILNDGRSAKITSQVVDPATNLVFFKADISNVSVANIANSQDLNVGEKVLFVKNSLQNFTAQSILSYVTSLEKDIQGQVFLSDIPTTAVGVSVNSNLINGQVLVNSNSEIVGIWNGFRIISSTNMQRAMALYYSSSQKIIRPSYGFSYTIITDNEGKLMNLKTGALVKEVTSLNAKQVGLQAGDIITSFEGKDINEQNYLEDVLQKYKPNDKVSISVFRKEQSLSINLIVSELK